MSRRAFGWDTVWDGMGWIFLCVCVCVCVRAHCMNGCCGAFDLIRCFRLCSSPASVVRQYGYSTCTTCPILPLACVHPALPHPLSRLPLYAACCRLLVTIAACCCCCCCCCCINLLSIYASSSLTAFHILARIPPPKSCLVHLFACPPTLPYPLRHPDPVRIFHS
ncbi:hypothetical protein K431DRAFT_45544 [Polychaeton citri CBS 116435]|uniref:Uncharacterized protein n=1 Tax=Polychaeton citri CBS 116435 TaxID=1314669 RepID=A0A9P4Q8H2_9PEZI|nr:hypothetical protein K431DRAFT_45544 [Polychaeton citri CBS 116435]